MATQDEEFEVISTPDSGTDDEFEVVFSPASRTQPQSSSSPVSEFGEAAARNAAQSATLGFQDELSGGSEALLGAADALITGSNNFGDEGRLSGLLNYLQNYQTARDTQRQQTKNASDKSTAGTITGSVLGALPLGIATGGGSLKAQVASGAGLGALNALGTGENRDVTTTLKDLTEAAALAGGLSYGINKLPKISAKGSKLIVDDGEKAVEFGQRMQKSLASKEGQTIVTQQILDIKPRAVEAINQSKREIGEQLVQAVEQNQGVAVAAKSAFSDTFEKLGSYNPQVDDVAVKAKSVLENKLKLIEDSLLASSPSKSLDDVPFEKLFQQKQELGSLIFEQDEFAKAPKVEQLAKKFYHSISKALNSSDETIGTGGAFSKLNKAYSALSETRADKIRGAMIKGLVDPQNTAAPEAFTKIFGRIGQLDPDVKTLIPRVTEIVDREIPEAILASKLVKQATNRLPSSGGASLTDLVQKLPVINYLTEAGRTNALSTLGAIQSKTGMASGQKAREVAKGALRAITTTSQRGTKE